MIQLVLKEMQSSAISRVVYDAFEKILFVEFKTSNAVWRYFDVPANVHADLVFAPSAGAKFAEIKRNFKGEKVEDSQWLKVVDSARWRTKDEVDALMNNANKEWLEVLKNNTVAVRF